MFRKPNRQASAISQAYPDGVACIYAVADSAAAGLKPVASYTPLHRLRYAEQRVGVTRYYEAMQATIQIDRVIRVPAREISTDNVLEDERGRWYRIGQVQTAAGVYPASLDLSLTRIITEEAEIYDGVD